MSEMVGAIGRAAGLKGDPPPPPLQVSSTTADGLRDELRAFLAASGARALVHTFRAMDASGDAVLNPSELRDGLAVLGFHAEEQVTTDLFELVDYEGNGSIGFAELAYWLDGAQGSASKFRCARARARPATVYRRP